MVGKKLKACSSVGLNSLDKHCRGVQVCAKCLKCVSVLSEETECAESVFLTTTVCFYSLVYLGLSCLAKALLITNQLINWVMMFVEYL